MLSGPSFRSAFVYSISSLILSGFPLTSFHLADANLVARAILEIENPLFRLPLRVKIALFSRPPTSLVQLRPKFFHTLDLGRPISNEPPLSKLQSIN